MEYQVTVSSTATTVYQVEAETAAEAQDIAQGRGRIVHSETTTPTVDNVTLVGPQL